MSSSSSPQHTAPPEGPGTASVVGRNISALLERRRAELERRSRQDRLADTITRFTGSMPFVYLHFFLFLAWIVVNLPGVPLPKFDPTFVVLAMFASVEAIFLSTFVLITQNRMAAAAEKRAELDLQISLLSEHELTRLIRLVAEISARLGVDAHRDPEIEEITQDVRPEVVLEQLEREQRKVGAEPGSA